MYIKYASVHSIQFKIDTRILNCILRFQMMNLSNARYFGWFSGYFYPATYIAP
jgi:hypothetical protein